MNDLTPLRARARVVLLVSLVALALLYVGWFLRDADPWAEWLVFALPPALLALGVWRGRRTAGFWSAVLAPRAVLRNCWRHSPISPRPPNPSPCRSRRAGSLNSRM